MSVQNKITKAYAIINPQGKIIFNSINPERGKCLVLWGWGDGIIYRREGYRCRRIEIKVIK